MVGAVGVVVVVAVVVSVVAVVLVGTVVVVAAPVVVVPRGCRTDAARAVATPPAATTPPSRRSQIARRIATECPSSYLFAPTDLGGCPCPVERARRSLVWLYYEP